MATLTDGTVPTRLLVGGTLRPGRGASRPVLDPSTGIVLTDVPDASKG